eukprot:TRINITY_DN71738_c0_g1_i1.p1 TRINITY_DN71738_c0_g1~~TRINITY_DN71738_c0_g1_i1.p1  ORF type:complete len:164 (-),score=38.20 TRINITY_DN71738_c0_g1_i1:46-501(-)
MAMKAPQLKDSQVAPELVGAEQELFGGGQSKGPSRTARIACFCIVDDEKDPRVCVSNGLLFSPNIAHHRGKALLGFIGAVLLAGFVLLLMELVSFGGVPGLAHAARDPNATEEGCCGGRRLALTVQAGEAVQENGSLLPKHSDAVASRFLA